MFTYMIKKKLSARSGRSRSIMFYLFTIWSFDIQWKYSFLFISFYHVYREWFVLCIQVSRGKTEISIGWTSILRPHQTNMRVWQSGFLFLLKIRVDKICSLNSLKLSFPAWIYGYHLEFCNDSLPKVSGSKTSRV